MEILDKLSCLLVCLRSKVGTGSEGTNAEGKIKKKCVEVLSW